VLLDNGRSEIASGPYREMLKCIKCGACLNACPVYRTVGGHAYGSTYPGPMGIIYTTLLNGIEASRPLLDATTLCGACADVCPPKVPLTELLRKLREERVERNLTPASERAGMTGFGLAAKHPSLFSVGQTAAKWGWPIAKTMNPAVRRMPNPAGVTFDRRMQ
jgi:L-lactate dehydrogenase complex protein LldF